MLSQANWPEGHLAKACNFVSDVERFVCYLTEQGDRKNHSGNEIG